MGLLELKTKELHDIYGRVVRLAPDECRSYPVTLTILSYAQSYLNADACMVSVHISELQWWHGMGRYIRV